MKLPSISFARLSMVRAKTGQDGEEYTPPWLPASKRERIRKLLLQAYWRADTPLELKFVRTLCMAFGYPDPIVGGDYAALRPPRVR